MSGVVLTPATGLRFLRCERPARTRPENMGIAAHWRAARALNPTLFDGPVVAVHSVEWESGTCLVRWWEARYSEYLVRAAPGNDDYARVLFVSVAAVTPTGRLLVGRSADHTSAPGRVHLPGGNVEPVPHLTADNTRSQALRELSEETGATIPANRLRLWLVKEGGAHGDVGLFYRWDDVDEHAVMATFDNLTATTPQPELAELLAADPHTFDPTNAVDYLPPLLRMLSPG